MKNFQKFRLASQLLFAALCVWIGVEFAAWLHAMETGATPLPARPPGVEAFLPISSLMNLVHWIHWGEIQLYHPAGVFIFLGIVASSFVLGKFFCSWMCPVGFLSEVAWKIRARILDSSPLPLPRWCDVLLRGVKYLLLAFFVYAIFVMMDARDIVDFLHSPYNLAADAKMYDFFANISKLAGAIIAVLVVVSLVVRNAWCRYFCPYGALLGLVGLLSPTKIKRTPYACINCEKCTKNCPAAISVHTAGTVVSDECSSCLECLSVCPSKNALNLTAAGTSKNLVWKFFPILAIVVYLSFIAWGLITNRWQNSVEENWYRDVIQNRKELSHPGKTGEFSE